MRQKVPWNPDGIDPEAREAAKEAARRAGMTLGEWLNATISDRAAKFGVDPRGVDPRGMDPRQELRHQESRHDTRSELSSDAYAPEPRVAASRTHTRVSSRNVSRAEPAETLDEVANRLNRLTRGKTQTASMAAPPRRSPVREMDVYADPYASEGYHDVEAIVSAAASESERRMRQGSARTASALDSVTRWMEKADERWNESTRETQEKMTRADQRWAQTLQNLQERVEVTDKNAGEAFRVTQEKLDRADQRWSESARQTLEQQERQSEIFNKAFGLVTRRLDDIEKRVTEGQQPALKPVWTAMERIEKQIGALAKHELSKTDEGRAQVEKFEGVLGGFERRLADIATRLTGGLGGGTPAFSQGNFSQSAFSQGVRAPLKASQLDQAIADIKAFQKAPKPVEERRYRQAAHQQAAHQAAQFAAQTNVQEDILHGLKRDMAKLATRLDTLHAEPEPQDVSVPLMRELAALHVRMQGLASRETVGALEEAVRDLGLRLINSRMEGASQGVIEPVERLYAEVRTLTQTLGANGESELAREVRNISNHIEKLGAASFDPRVVEHLTADISDLRALVGKYDQTDRLSGLTQQIGDLSSRLADMGQRQIDALEFASLKSCVEDIRTGLRQKPASRVGKDANAGVPDIIAMFGQQLDSLGAKVDMLANRQPDDTATQTLSARIEQLVHKVDAQPKAITSRLDELTRSLSSHLTDQPKALASHFAALNAKIEKGPQEIAASLGSQLEAQLDSKLAALAKRIDRGPVTLAAHLETLAGKLNSDPNELIDRIEQLSSKLSSTPSEVLLRLDELADRFESSSHTDLSAQFERLASRLNTSPLDVASKLDELSHKFDAHKFDSRPDDLADRIDQLTMRIEAGAFASATPVAAPDPELHGLLKALVTKMDETQKPQASVGALDSLEQQIRDIAAKLEQPAHKPEAFNGLEQAMGDLVQRLDALKNETVAASESAARQAVSEALAKLPTLISSSISPSPAPSSAATREDGIEKKLLGGLSKDVSELKTAQNAADQRTQHTMDAVHDTLDKVVSRLAQLETGLNETKIATPVSAQAQNTNDVVRAAREDMISTKSSPVAPAPSVRAQAFGFVTPKEQAIVQQSIPQEALLQNVPQEASVQEHLPPVFTLDVPELADVPIEPGTAAFSPARRQAPAGEMDIRSAMNRASDSQDVKANFIAAARRAAQAAAAEANAQAETSSQKGGMAKASSAVAEKLAARLAARQNKDTSAQKVDVKGLGQSEIKVPETEASASLLSKLRSTVEARRRPLLLGLAAIMLAMGATQIVGGLMGESEDAKMAQGIQPLPNDNAASMAAQKQSSPQTQELLTGGTQPVTNAPVQAPAQETLKQEVPQQELPKGESPAGGDKRSDLGTSRDITGSIATAFSPTPIQQQKPELQKASSANASMNENLSGGSARVAQGNSQQSPAQVKATQSAALNPEASTPQQQGTVPSELPRLSGIKDVGALPANAGTQALRKASLSGDAVAVYDLASRLAEGRGAPRDAKLAAKLFERAAAEGIAPAQYRLGNMYEKGIGVSRDITLARQWYTRAAEKGNAKAMHNLAVMIAEGGGGKPDYASAVKWFEQASQMGVRDSQYNLAILLARGLGTQQSLVRSYVMFAVAGAQGDSDALKKRDEVGARLSATDLEMAKAEAQSFKPKSNQTLANEIIVPQGRYEDQPTQKTQKNVRG
jgi:localization factor PodJL